VFSNKIIPAVKTVKGFEAFLKSEYEYCVLMNLHLSMLSRLVEKAHASNKKCLLHLDLINGITSDEYGAEYAIQQLNVDGLVSTKTSVIKIAKKKKVLAVYRVFLIDNYSLGRSLDRVSELRPDYVEILPALAHKIIPRIKETISIPIIGGGLIATKDDIDECINSGMVGVTTSDVDLW
jgi:glycerol uptake operon antiterminator